MIAFRVKTLPLEPNNQKTEQKNIVSADDPHHIKMRFS